MNVGASTNLNTTGLDKLGRTIVYSEGDSVTNKNQINYHDNQGNSLYTLSVLDYTNLKNLPTTLLTMSLNGEDYPSKLQEDTYDTLKINGVQSNTKLTESIKKGNFVLPSEGRYEFERYCEGNLVDNEVLVCLYSKNMAYNIEDIKDVDISSLLEIHKE